MLGPILDRDAKICGRVQVMITSYIVGRSRRIQFRDGQPVPPKATTGTLALVYDSVGRHRD